MLLQTIDISQPSLGLPQLVLILIALCTIGLLAFAIYKNRWKAARVSIIFALFSSIVFQWPTILLYDLLAAEVEKYRLMIVASTLVPLLFAVWGCFTDFLDRDRNTDSPVEFGLATFALLVALIVALVYVYIDRVPATCTALYVLFFDPTYTLIAREVAIKFAGSIWATYSFGAVANSIVPVFVGLSIASIFVFARSMRFLPILILVPLVCVSVFIVLLGGSKGLLIPTAVFLVGSGLAWFGNLFVRVVYVAFAIAALFGALLVFEIIKERPSIADGRGYQFGTCIATLDACTRAEDLLSSLTEREYSLGLTFAQVAELEAQRAAVCGPSEAEGRSDRPGSANQSDWRDRLPEAGRHQTVTPAPVNWRERASLYAHALIYRAMVTPIQVASWHYLYVSEEGHPGLAAMPLGTRLAGHRVDMASVVYQRYGTVFSQGDATATSTAPTSFLMAYPANLGLAGVVLVLFLIIALDIGYATIVRFLSPPMLGVAAGLTLVICTNLILSDFVTVMETHGGAVAIALLSLFAAPGFFRWARSMLSRAG